jgi:hypothetical protein
MNTTADTLDDLEIFAHNHHDWLFRGQCDPNWLLETSLEKASRRCSISQQKYEKAVVREFQRHAHAYLHRVPNSNDYVEWLALMQHHGAPTRFLDFTLSFWIALFFAYEEAETDCVVWALNPKTLGDKTGKDFNVVLKENILNGRHKDDRLYQDVPFYTNERLAIQKGTFVFSLNLNHTFHDLLIQNQKEYNKLTVRSSLFPEIRKKLNEFNCNSRVLFPGIDGYARYFKNHSF